MLQIMILQPYSRCITGSIGIDLEEQNASIREHFGMENNKVEDPGLIYTGGIYRLISSDYIFTGPCPLPG